MICFMEFEVPCEITILGCNPKHFLHKECYDQWIKHHEGKRSTATCPLCRANIDVSKSKLVTYKGLNTPNVKPQEVEIKELAANNKNKTESKLIPSDQI